MEKKKLEVWSTLHLASIPAIMKKMKRKTNRDTYSEYVLIWNPVIALQILWRKWEVETSHM